MRAGVPLPPPITGTGRYRLGDPHGDQSRGHRSVVCPPSLTITIPGRGPAAGRNGRCAMRAPPAASDRLIVFGLIEFLLPHR